MSAKQLVARLDSLIGAVTTRRQQLEFLIDRLENVDSRFWEVLRPLLTVDISFEPTADELQMLGDICPPDQLSRHIDEMNRAFRRARREIEAPSLRSLRNAVQDFDILLDELKELRNLINEGGKPIRGRVIKACTGAATVSLGTGILVGDIKIGDPMSFAMATTIILSGVNNWAGVLD